LFDIYLESQRVVVAGITVHREVWMKVRLNRALPAQNQKLECLCGALGPVGEGGVLVQVILLGESSQRWALTEDVVHYHAERIHQGQG
jgi:hypothetical protein